MAELWEMQLCTELSASAPFPASPHMLSQLQLAAYHLQTPVHFSFQPMLIFGVLLPELLSARDPSLSTR